MRITKAFWGKTGPYLCFNNTDGTTRYGQLERERNTGLEGTGGNLLDPCCDQILRQDVQLRSSGSESKAGVVLYCWKSLHSAWC